MLFIGRQLDALDALELLMLISMIIADIFSPLGLSTSHRQPNLSTNINNQTHRQIDNSTTRLDNSSTPHRQLIDNSTRQLIRQLIDKPTRQLIRQLIDNYRQLIDNSSTTHRQLFDNSSTTLRQLDSTTDPTTHRQLDSSTTIDNSTFRQLLTTHRQLIDNSSTTRPDN
ncbi:hypothetical protein MMC07_004979 [Pseudocyphellaria aurata]|nr:hypothetical protein [Pseudocyphellaria aurata]